MFRSHFLDNLKIFLKKENWKVYDTQYQGLLIYLNDSFPEIKLTIPRNIEIPDSEQRIWDSINFLALIRGEESEVFIDLLNQFDMDFHKYRVPGKDISSVSLNLA